MPKIKFFDEDGMYVGHGDNEALKPVAWLYVLKDKKGHVVREVLSKLPPVNNLLINETAYPLCKCDKLEPITGK